VLVYALLVAAENSFRQPNGGDKNVDGIREKRRLVAFNEMSQPCEREGGGNEEQGNDPMPPDDDHGRETYGDRDHVQGAVNGMVVRAVVVRVQTHISTPTVKRLDGGALYPWYYEVGRFEPRYSRLSTLGATA